ncbi:ileal sodium/bile acid cotransporter-like [Diadema antillarum]|uniref:ileal sodium/bile acid cotransporter-like n=1 Tax=Diadema antillarum TaxID=105358 RepID=UPI003A88C302
MAPQLCRLLFLMTIIGAASSTLAQISFDNFTDVFVNEGQSVDVNLTLVEYDGPRSELFFESASNFDFVITNGSGVRFPLDSNTTLPTTYKLVLRGRHLSVSSLKVMVSEVGSMEATVRAEVPVKVTLNQSQFQVIVNYLFNVPIVITYLLMGILLDLKVIWECLRRPLGITIGCFCQFVVMPALSFGIGKMLQMETAAAVGLLLAGCCPGGNMSNNLSVLMNADYMLSVTMTAFSSVLALGTMPLNIFIYIRFIVDEQLDTPFDQIAMQLAIMITPLFVGILIRLKFPDADKKAKKVVKPFVACTFVIVGALNIPFQLHIFYSPWDVYLSSLMLPLFGALLGGTIAMIAGLKKAQVLAIAFETGIQNAGIAYIILLSAFPRPESTLAARVPFVTMMMAFFLSMLAFLVNFILTRVICKNRSKDDASETSVLDDKDAITSVGKYKSNVSDSGVEDDTGLYSFPSKESEKDLTTLTNHAYINDQDSVI